MGRFSGAAFSAELSKQLDHQFSVRMRRRRRRVHRSQHHAALGPGPGENRHAWLTTGEFADLANRRTGPRDQPRSRLSRTALMVAWRGLRSRVHYRHSGPSSPRCPNIHGEVPITLSIDGT